jgi:hypothetical protein
MRQKRSFAAASLEPKPNQGVRGNGQRERGRLGTNIVNTSGACLWLNDERARSEARFGHLSLGGMPRQLASLIFQQGLAGARTEQLLQWSGHECEHRIRHRIRRFSEAHEGIDVGRIDRLLMRPLWAPSSAKALSPTDRRVDGMPATPSMVATWHYTVLFLIRPDKTVHHF